jgi:enoyl-CoA hydratase
MSSSNQAAPSDLAAAASSQQVALWAQSGVTVSREGRIAVVRFDASDKANALSISVMRALLSVARSFEADSQLSAVVLTGAADKFSLGFDLRDAQQVSKLTLAARREAQALGPRLCQAWEEIEALTLVAIEGWCVGGGVALAGAFDLRVAGQGARFYIPEIERGMNMSWGSLPRLVNLVGPARAKQMVILAEKVDAVRAHDWGFVQYLSASGLAFEEAVVLARRAASMPPVQLRMCKSGINAYANALARSTSIMDRDQYLLAQSSGDYAEGVSSFLEKRPAKFEGQ